MEIFSAWAFHTYGTGRRRWLLVLSPILEADLQPGTIRYDGPEWIAFDPETLEPVPTDRMDDTLHRHLSDPIVTEGQVAPRFGIAYAWRTPPKTELNRV